MFGRIVTAALSVILVLPPFVASAAEGLPNRTAPAGLRVVDVPAGGRILTGSLEGVASPADAFRRGLERVRPYFDRPPQIASAVRSTDGSLGVALFRGAVNGQSVAGLAFVVYGRNGGSRIAVALDRPAHLQASLKPLLARLYALQPAFDAGSAVALRPVVSPDRSVRIAIPPGWKTPILAQGQAVVIGPSGEEVDKQFAVNFLDPRGSIYQSALALQQSSGIRPHLSGIPMPYVGDAAQAYAAASKTIASMAGQPDPNVAIVSSKRVADPYAPGSSVDQIEATLTVNGVRKRVVGNVMSSPPNQFGAWTVAMNLVSAPETTFKRVFPTLSAINASYGIDQAVRGRQVGQTIEMNREGIARNGAIAQQTQARNAAVFNASMSHARQVQDGIDRSTAGFVHYLGDTDVVEHMSTGTRSTVDYNFAASIVQTEPQAFRTVPVSEYRRGVDY